MHLFNILKKRSKPLAGIYFSITRKCPLTCSHCSTNSSLIETEKLRDDEIIEFIKTFQQSIPPEIVLLTGGEALLHPKLIKNIALQLKKMRVKSYLISGMFFASEGKIPVEIVHAIKELDHFSASIDIYHEKHVSRKKVLSTLKEIKKMGVDISIQTVCSDNNYEYLQKLITDIRVYFEDEVPIFVAKLGSAGRAQKWVPKLMVNESRIKHIDPCKFSTWPVVTFNGDIVACCNQKVVDGPTPQHLKIANINTTSWPEIREHVSSSEILRSIRTWGPRHTSMIIDSSCDGSYCDTCMGLSNKTDNYEKKLALYNNRKDIKIKELLVGDLLRENISFSAPGYSNLLTLGYSHHEESITQK